jgi:hypothetical protein
MIHAQTLALILALTHALIHAQTLAQIHHQTLMIKKETTKIKLEEMTLDAKILIHKIQILKFIKK